MFNGIFEIFDPELSKPAIPKLPSWLLPFVPQPRNKTYAVCRVDSKLDGMSCLEQSGRVIQDQRRELLKYRELPYSVGIRALHSSVMDCSYSTFATFAWCINSRSHRFRPRSMSERRFTRADENRATTSPGRTSLCRATKFVSGRGPT